MRRTGTLYKSVYSYEVDFVKIFGTLTVGAAGAVSAVQGGGIESITKETAAGQYTVKLQDGFDRLLMLQAIAAKDAIAAGVSVQLLSDDIQGDLKGEREITFQIVDAAGDAVNLADGDKLLLEITVRRSSVGRYDA